MSVVRVKVTKAEAEVAREILGVDYPALGTLNLLGFVAKDISGSIVLDVSRILIVDCGKKAIVEKFIEAAEAKITKPGMSLATKADTSGLFTSRGEAHGVAMREYGVNTFNPNDQGECAPDAPLGRMAWRIVPYKVSFERIEEKG